MLTPTQVSLDSELVKTLQQIASEQGKTLDQVLEESAKVYLRENREASLLREQEAYVSIHAELKRKYLGQHVAIYNQELVDHDLDAMALVRRIRRRFGNAPVLFCEVEEQTEREYVIRSPRLEKPL